MLEAQNISLAHGKLTVLDQINLRFEKAQVTALCGPNGAGKSTLLSALSGDMRPKQGVILLGGTDIAKLGAAELAKQRAVLEQSPTLSAPFDVATLTELAIPKEVPALETERIVADVLADLGLTKMRTRPVHTLSGGQQHRAHLARALAQLQAGRFLGGGQVLMLDEPTSSLDITHQIAVMRAARTAARDGATVIVVLHDLNLAAAFSDRIVMLHRGGIAADGTTEQALTSPLLSQIYETEIKVTTQNGRPFVAPTYAIQPTPEGAVECISP